MQTELATISPVPDFLSAIPDVATRSEAIALDSEYSALRKKTAKQMWQMGRICRQQKEILEPHGVYHQWLAYQGISTSTASAWVNTDIFADIDPELFEAAVDNFVSSALLRVSAPSFRKENPAGVELAMAIAASGEKVDTSTVEAIAKTPDALIREAIALTREGEVPSRKLLQDLQERTRKELVRQTAELYAPWGEFRAITAEDRAIALGDLSRWHYVFVGVEQIKPFTSPEAAVEAHSRVCTPATRKTDNPLTREEIEGYYRAICEVVEWSPTEAHPDRLLVKRTSDPIFSSEFLMLQSAWVEWKNLRSGWAKLGESGGVAIAIGKTIAVQGAAYQVVGIEDDQIQCVKAGDDPNHPDDFYFFEEEDVQIEVPNFGTQKRERVANDYYPTPDGIVQVLLDKVSIQGKVLEPCAGHLAIASHFQDCITNEPFPIEGFDVDYNADATDPTFWEALDLDGGVDWVVTNPPYGGLATPITIAALTHARKGVAMLLRLNWLEPCSERAAILNAHTKNMSDIIVFNPRPQFRKDTAGTDNITVAWMVWQQGWEGGCRMHFCSNWKDAE